MTSSSDPTDHDTEDGAPRLANAVTYDRYGAPEVLELRPVEVEPLLDDRVRVRVRAASVNPVDWHGMRGSPYLVRMGGGFRRPKQGRLGADLAGVVEAVGRQVTRLRPGDEVFGMSAGTLAEYVQAQEEALAPKPANLTFDQAAAVPVAGLTALQGLRDQGQIQSGQRVLINGASGGVGTFAVQIAKSYGAEVTGVCSTRNLDLVRSIGADHVIDYTGEDFSRGDVRYDLVFDVAGNRSLSALRRTLRPRGTLVLAAGPAGDWLGPLALWLRGLAVAPFVRHRIRFFLAKPSLPDLLLLKELIEAGKVTPVVDRSYPLTGIREAMRYLEAGHARGKVVITI